VTIVEKYDRSVEILVSYILEVLSSFASIIQG
jgi:hypothetical protein